MYVDNQMHGFWGDLKRKVKKNVKKIGVVSAFIPAVGITAGAIAKPVETAALATGVAAGGAAVGAGITSAASAAGAGSGLLTKAESLLKDPRLARAEAILKDPRLKSTLDAARSLLKKPAAPVAAEATETTQPTAGSFNPLLLAGLVGIPLTFIALSRKRK